MPFPANSANKTKGKVTAVDCFHVQRIAQENARVWRVYSKALLFPLSHLRYK